MMIGVEIGKLAAAAAAAAGNTSGITGSGVSTKKTLFFFSGWGIGMFTGVGCAVKIGWMGAIGIGETVITGEDFCGGSCFVPSFMRGELWTIG